MSNLDPAYIIYGTYLTIALICGMFGALGKIYDL